MYASYPTATSKNMRHNALDKNMIACAICKWYILVSMVISTFLNGYLKKKLERWLFKKINSNNDDKYFVGRCKRFWLGPNKGCVRFSDLIPSLPTQFPPYSFVFIIFFSSSLTYLNVPIKLQSSIRSFFFPLKMSYFLSPSSSNWNLIRFIHTCFF